MSVWEIFISEKNPKHEPNGKCAVASVTYRVRVHRTGEHTSPHMHRVHSTEPRETTVLFPPFGWGNNHASWPQPAFEAIDPILIQ